VIGDANRLRKAGKIVGERLEIDALREADDANLLRAPCSAWT
jgi:hypothetical protein